jgi:protease-4
MKNFFVSLLGTLAGLALFCSGLVVVGIVLVAGVLSSATSSGSATKIERGSYLVLSLDANLTDSPPAYTLDGSAAGSLLGGGPAVLQLRTATRALRAAAKDDRIAGLFLTGSLAPDGYGTGFAALKELRAALHDFKAAKKPVVAHLVSASTRDLYLAACADDLALDPFGEVLLPGLASQPVFFAGTFEKFGVGVQVTRVGKYKSAIEPYTRKDMSPESREQLQKLLDDIWGEVRADIAADRSLQPGDIQAIADQAGFLRAADAVKAGLVSRSAYRDEIITKLKMATGRDGADKDKPFKQITLADYVGMMGDANVLPTGVAPKGPRIAIVYAEGAIVDGEGGAGEVGGARFSRALRRLREDDDVKAIVLRVNSPGGAVGASEQIQRELRLAREAGKPVIVSMGSYAASGGYWISAYADKIFAEPSSITGSIGVFGLQLDVQRLANSLGLTFDTVKTGKFADTLTIARPKTDEELAVVQKLVDWIYGEFVGKVAEARKLPRATVEEIAQGRVWSGAEAKKLGLVDELGGLDAALAEAARQAKLGERYATEEFPRPKELLEAVAELLDRTPGRETDAAVAGGVVSRLVDQVKAQARELEQFNDPRGLYARLPLEILLR